MAQNALRAQQQHPLHHTMDPSITPGNGLPWTHPLVNRMGVQRQACLAEAPNPELWSSVFVLLLMWYYKPAVASKFTPGAVHSNTPWFTNWPQWKYKWQLGQKQPKGKCIRRYIYKQCLGLRLILINHAITLFWWFLGKYLHYNSLLSCSKLFIIWKGPGDQPVSL